MMSSPQLKQVIITEQETRGLGKSMRDPVRRILQVFDTDGNLIAENDPCPATITHGQLYEFGEWLTAHGRVISDQDIDNWLDAMYPRGVVKF